MRERVGVAVCHPCFILVTTVKCTIVFSMKKLAITSLRTVKWLVIGLLILLLLSAGGLVVWVSTGPHSVAWVKDKFLQNLNSKPDLFNVKIEDVVVQFDGWDKPLGLHAVNTTVLLPGGQLFTSVPDIDLSIDWLAVLGGEIALDEVRVVSPSLYLHRSDEGLIMIGNNEGDSTHTVPLSVLLGGIDMGGSGTAVTPDIFIEDATLRLYSETLGSSINVVEGYVALRAKQGATQ